LAFDERGKKNECPSSTVSQIKEKKKVLMNDAQPRLNDVDKHIVGAK
jgi:hypothetical protein